MANSVVKVTDVKDDINDSLLLLVGEDGTVMPDKETVEMFLSSKEGPTKLQIMHIDKSDSRGIDLSVDNVTYMPENMEVANIEDVVIREDMDEVARNLYNFKLDHDYTSLSSPQRPSVDSDEVDELTKTLSILHGSGEHEPPETVPPSKVVKSSSNVNILSSITIPPVLSKTPVKSTPVEQTPVSIIEKSELPSSLIPVVEDEKAAASSPKTKSKPKLLNIQQLKGKLKNLPNSRKNKKIIEEEEPEVANESDGLTDEEEDYDEADFDMDGEDDENDLDFVLDEEIKVKTLPKRRGRKVKVDPKTLSKPSRTTLVKSKRSKMKDAPGTPKQESEKNAEKDQEKNEKESEKFETKLDDAKPESKLEAIPDTKQLEKKHPKREKKPPKPIPNDFALFSTPDIIRRVGGKEAPVAQEIVSTQKLNKESSKVERPTEPTGPTKPAKIIQESRSKSVSSETSQSPTKHRHSSLDGKIAIIDKEKTKDKEKQSTHRSSNESRNKDRRSSLDIKSRNKTNDEKSNKPELKTPSESKSAEAKQDSKTYLGKLSQLRQASESLDHIPSAADVRAIIMNEDTKTYTTNTIPIPDVNVNTIEPTNLNLDGSGLDLDQSILDNINNDMISEDILYQVAQQLVSNTDIQNAIDKGINEGVLDTRSIQEAMEVQDQLSNSASIGNTSAVIKEGTQIVRSDGRIVVIPPIERPTTRSRNRKKDDPKPPFKQPIKAVIKIKGRTIHKPLDDEHVSGNELDSPNEEEESEDDPNKLWCICNQPHNNRFMICCDTCEEWYHGKCVNITKAMGQQMESEGKEWICLFCKNPSMKRPLAAARRVRKASRNSRASTDSSNSSKKIDKEKSTSSVPCVVCQKAARKNSIYCSENCILTHAQGIERVVVFERSTGNMLTGNKAPSSANLDQWLKEHPGYEVVKSAGKVVTTKVKPNSLSQSKLKFVKNANNEGVSLAIQQKGINIGVLKHAPKHQTPEQQIRSFKIVKPGNKEITPKESKIKLIQAQPMSITKTQTPTVNPKITIQTTLTPKATPKPKESPKDKQQVTNKTLKLKNKEKSKEKEEQIPTTPQSNRENIRDNVQKTIFEQLLIRLKTDPNIKLTDDEVKTISNDIELELHKCFGGTGHKYKNKYRSLIFNIKDAKNQTLWRRICEKSISSYELVRLSPDDMASQELAKWREQEAKHQLDMIKKSELELLNSSRQYVLKTHKGEEILEDNRPGAKVDNAEIIKSLTEGSPLDGGDKDRDNAKDKDRDRKSSKHGRKDKSRDRGKDRKESHRSRRSSSRERDRSRKRSRSRDKLRHSDKKKDKRSRSRSRDKDRYKKSSHKSSKHKRSSSVSNDNLDKRSKEILEQLNKIAPPVEDRLWKHVPQEDILPAPIDSDSDHEIPSSTVTIPTPPRVSETDEYQAANQSSNDSKSSILPVHDEQNDGAMSPPPKVPAAEIWSGTINMVDVAQISITAHEVSGDCTRLSKELPTNLDIVGRISPDTVWDYIGKMKCSNSKVISLVRLNATNVEEQMPYLALYSYLSSRNRLGVVKSTNKAIKDFYILPLASQKPIPQALLPLNGPGFEESRPALLLGIIIRDKRKRPFMESLPLPLHTTTPKKLKVDVIIQSPLPAATPARSYTPPPVPSGPATVKCDPRLNKLPLPPPTPPEEIEGGDEPYSPEDSDPETVAAPAAGLLSASLTTVVASSLPETNLSEETYTPIPGLGDGLPSSKLDIQRQMDELNYKIEMQKFEITSITKNIATAGSEIGPSALANIALPSNLQQILESIKTIGSGSDATEKEPAVPGTSQTDLTIPLMIPKTFTRPLSAATGVKSDIDTIPLNLPSKPKIKPQSVNSPLYDSEKSTSVLGSLTEEDLIRKAAEMLKEDDPGKNTLPPNFKTTPPPIYRKSSSVYKAAPPVNYKTTPPPNYVTTPPPNFIANPPPGFNESPPSGVPPSKKSKYEVQLPPVPGVD
ncbi:uncharacterized protein LOC132697387 isoform X2 [Cylas formicarius]|uniref:uncharacterized protein LOC132697387 isoform X2 n=1 Tax=Cylas formicarius TaxID=197179 RepID=UPI0029583D13|nr:uncharacterized protein LOC132697387 isoform X2 [Cylas formicarius]